MSIITNCGFLVVFLLVIQSSDSLPKFGWPWFSGKSEDTNATTSSNATTTSPIVTTHKAPARRVLRNQTSLFILLDTTTLEDTHWHLLQSYNIKKMVDLWANQPGEPIFDYYFAQMQEDQLEVTISSENYTEFLEDLKRVKVNVSESGICPEYTLQGLVDVFEYTLPDPYIYVITDSSENDAIIEQNAVTTIEDKNATVSFVITGNCANFTNATQAFARIANISRGDIADFDAKKVMAMLNEPPTGSKTQTASTKSPVQATEKQSKTASENAIASNTNGVSTIENTVVVDNSNPPKTTTVPNVGPTESGAPTTKPTESTTQKVEKLPTEVDDTKV